MTKLCDKINKNCLLKVIDPHCNELCKDVKQLLIKKTTNISNNRKRILCNRLWKLNHCPICGYNNFHYKAIYGLKYERNINIGCSFCNSLFVYNTFVADNKLIVQYSELLTFQKMDHVSDITIKLDFIVDIIDKLKQECLESGPYPKPLSPKDELNLMAHAAQTGDYSYKDITLNKY